MRGAWNTAMAGALAAALAAGGCASNRQRELEEQNRTLAAACDDLRRQNGELQREIATLKGGHGIRDAYIRKLEEETALLKKMLETMGGPDTAPEGTEIIPGGLRLLGDFFFRPGSDNVSPEGVSTLKRIAEAVKAQGAFVRIVGHTDNDPIKRTIKDYTTGMNLELGAARAVAVAHELKKAGVDEARLHVVSMGDSAPIASNDTKEGKKKNRRVDIFFSPRAPEGAAPAKPSAGSK